MTIGAMAIGVIGDDWTEVVKYLMSDPRDAIIHTGLWWRALR